MTTRTFTPPVIVDGVPVMVESSFTIPLVDVVFVLTTGSFEEPGELEGLARVFARALRAGPKDIEGAEFEDAVASLGGRVGIDVGTGHVRVHGTVIARNLVPFVRLVGNIITNPGFRARDIERVRRECLADLASSLDDDRWLAGRAVRRALFGAHALSRSLVGTRKSLRAIRRQDLRDFHDLALARDRLYVGFSGAIEAPLAHELVRELFHDLPRRSRAHRRVADPKQPRGLRFILVDKPERTQCQLIGATLGSKVGDPLTFALHVANTAFGGMFSGPLVHEIRVKRGYSYGAGSRLAQDVCRDAWSMSTFPTAEHVVDCTRTMLDLQRTWVRDGGKPRQVGAAKKFLVNGRCFEEDTPSKRLEAKLDLVIHGQPEEHWTRFDSLVREVSASSAADAVRARISCDDLVVGIVGSAKAMSPGLRALAPAASFDVVSHRLVE